jgi:hypothetical protein
MASDPRADASGEQEREPDVPSHPIIGFVHSVYCGVCGQEMRMNELTGEWYKERSKITLTCTRCNVTTDCPRMIARMPVLE